MATNLSEVRLGVLAGQKNYRALREALGDMNEVDVALFIEALPEEQMLVTFRTLHKDQAMDVFAELSAETQQHLIEAFSDREVGALVDELAVDDAVDMLEELPAALVKRVLQHSGSETRRLLNEFLRYPEHSAGSIMTAEFTDLRRNMTVEDAIKRIRRTGQDRETIYTCYVIDDTRHLNGVVTVKDLLLAHDSARVADLMETDIIRVTTGADQEEVAALMARYDFLSLPVVDGEDRLVGIVTVDDAVDVMQEEATEDFEKMAAMAPSEKPYLKTGALRLARNRFLWLLVLMASGIVTGSIMGRFEAALTAFPLLLTFIPMLMGAGGNAGSQSSTMVIRGMALGEVRPADILPVLWKELRVSLLIALPLSTVNMLRIAVFYPAHMAEGLVLSLAMMGTVVLANVLGGALPIGAKACRLDPAIMATPLITTLVDACSLALYFAIAFTMLPL